MRFKTDLVSEKAEDILNTYAELDTNDDGFLDLGELTPSDCSAALPLFCILE